MTKVVLAAIAKNEGAYLPEWVAHHLFMGFDEIHVWVNGSDDNSLKTLEKISNVEPRVVPHDADDFLKMCQEQNLPFQTEAYDETLTLARGVGASHMMALDVDEYLMTSSLCMTVKDILRNNSADVISFVWHSDKADHAAEPFLRAVSPVMEVQRDRLVKSIVRLSDRVAASDVHTFDVTDGDYRLATGERFPVAAEKFDRVSREYMLAHSGQPDMAFVLHRMHRSPVEYLAGLLRGRQHVKDNINVLKTNRHGFMNSSRLVRHEISPARAYAYERYVSEQIAMWDVSGYVESDRQAVLSRAKTVLSMVQSNPQMQGQYKQVLAGLDLDNPPKKPPVSRFVQSHIDSVVAEWPVVKISGWAYNVHGEVDTPKVAIKGTPVKVEYRQSRRPDVRDAFDLSTEMCGFQITAEDPGLGKVTKDDVSLTF